METRTEGADGLVTGILADADAEGRRLVAEAEAYAEESRLRAAERAKAILAEAAEKAEAQASSIIAEARARASVERRQRRLAFQERLAKAIVAKARARVASMVGEPEYRPILARWLGEAALGLSAETATVRVSAAERPLMDRSALQSAERLVAAKTGTPCALRLGEAGSEAPQGVYLVAEGGRLAYDATVDTRFGRRGAELRAMIYKALFQDGDRDQKGEDGQAKPDGAAGGGERMLAHGGAAVGAANGEVAQGDNAGNE